MIKNINCLGIIFGLFVFFFMGNSPADARKVRIMFLHHSTGNDLIEKGSVRQGLTDLGYAFYDHGYNEEGLRMANGKFAHTNFNVTGDNTDPDGFAAIFRQPLHIPPDNTFSHLMQYDVIAFKSCFPVSNIASNEQLEEYKNYYKAIRKRMAQFPDKVFIIVTQPPQVPSNTNPQESRRARTFANWLQSDDYLSGHHNMFVFDFFDLLADKNNFLKAKYRMDEHDAHPNALADRTIGPMFVAFIDEAIKESGIKGRLPEIAAPTPTGKTDTMPQSPDSSSMIEQRISETPAETASRPPSTIARQGKDGIIEDFEANIKNWNSSTDGSGSTFEINLDTGSYHGGKAALHLKYSIKQGGYGDCGTSFDPIQDWSGSQGLSLWIHSRKANQKVKLMLFSGDPQGATPFETYISTTEKGVKGWVQHKTSLDEFVRSPWADQGGLSRFDPKRVIGYGFNVESEAGKNDNSIWIDDIGIY